MTKTIYEGIDGSTYTTLTVPVGTSDTVVSVGTTDYLPDAPNICTLYHVANGEITSWERCKYTNKTSHTVTISRSGDEHASNATGDAALSFVVGDRLARLITNWDFESRDEDVTLRALDSEVVHNTSDESVAGVKTFTSIPILPGSNPTSDNQAVRKAYVDAVVSGAVILLGSWDASANDPNITSTTTTGSAWRVSVAGSTDLGGITDWEMGDLAVKTSTSWMKIDNEDIGAVWGNISGTLSDQTDLQGELDDKQDNITALDTSSIDLTLSSGNLSASIIVDNSTIEVDTTNGVQVKDEGITVEKLEANATTPTNAKYYRGDGSWQELVTGVASAGNTATITMDITDSVITAGIVVPDDENYVLHKDASGNVVWGEITIDGGSL